MELDRARHALSMGESLLLDRNEQAPAAPRIALGRGVAGLQAAQDHLTRFLSGAGCHKRILYRAEIVVKEAVSNIRQHAELPDRPARAWVEAWMTERQAIIALEDDGPPFDPTPLLTAPSNSGGTGRGLREIRRNADELRYARTEAGRNRLVLHIGLLR